MARTPLLPIRVDADTKARWEEAAADARQSVSEFVRDAVEDRINQGSKAKPARRKAPRAPAGSTVQALPGDCPRAHFHRPGTFCKACGRGF